VSIVATPSLSGGALPPTPSCPQGIDVEWVPVSGGGHPAAGRGEQVHAALADAQGSILLVPPASGWMPDDLGAVLQPLLEGQCDAVYAISQAAGGAQLATRTVNLIARLGLHDVEGSFKAFRTSLLRSVPLDRSSGSFDVEVTIKLARRHARMVEIRCGGAAAPAPRGSHAGEVLVTALTSAFTTDLYTDKGAAILDSFSVARRFNRWMAQTIAPYAGDDVLEIGAGMGNLAAQLAPGRNRYVATDIDPEHLSRLESRLGHLAHLETALCDLGRPHQLDSFAGQMDTVVCLNVLEHVEDEAAGLGNMYEALRSGGRAIVLVPEGPSIYGSLDVVLGHYRRYTREQLAEAMGRAGFVVEDVLGFNRVSRPAWFISGRVVKRESIGKFQLRMFDRTVWFWRWADSRLPWKPTSVIGIGRKP
jgi:2-polyprenyl-3-methyl-5-hydroxy-6-metoxy-1,4-benzoquinol methylase